VQRAATGRAVQRGSRCAALCHDEERLCTGGVGGGETAALPADHVDVERWVKGPKGPERRIHGPGHAGGRIVRHGPTLMLALDAPVPHDGPLTVDALAPSGHARVPESQQQAVERGKMMRQARSRKQRPVLLADLAQRSLNAL